LRTRKLAGAQQFCSTGLRPASRLDAILKKVYFEVEVDDLKKKGNVGNCTLLLSKYRDLNDNNTHQKLFPHWTVNAIRPIPSLQIKILKCAFLFIETILL